MAGGFDYAIRSCTFDPVATARGTDKTAGGRPGIALGNDLLTDDFE
jgi:hypothetical protein